ncbi:hypothetical protein V8C86DRAFT_3023704 [Haematococcus lacustris]
MANPVIRTPDAHPPAEASGWTQKYKDNTVSVLDLFNRLMKSSALRNTYRLKLDVTRKVVLVVYLMCGANLFCCNLSNVQSQHDKHCKQRPASEQPPPLPNPTGKQVHPDDQQLSDKCVALFVATTGTPHAALKNKFLKKAFRALGATCPSPKRVKTLIRDVYLETRQTVEADLSSLFKLGRRKHVLPSLTLPDHFTDASTALTSLRRPLPRQSTPPAQLQQLAQLDGQLAQAAKCSLYPIPFLS